MCLLCAIFVSVLLPLLHSHRIHTVLLPAIQKGSSPHGMPLITELFDRHITSSSMRVLGILGETLELANRLMHVCAVVGAAVSSKQRPQQVMHIHALPDNNMYDVTLLLMTSYANVLCTCKLSTGVFLERHPDRAMH